MSQPRARAVVFAYHDVGVRCLRALLAQGVEVALVLTHADAPGERTWFESVAEHARWHGLAVAEPEAPNEPAWVARVAALEPDFLFSFYYRHLLGAPMLATARRGAYNMHGSLLPSYRGRVPVNWAVLNGERETGATLHAMTVKPDAGEIIEQQAVPILPDDTAVEVFRKVTVAAELALVRALPLLLAGKESRRAQPAGAGSYYGRRTARDGAINWALGARAVHNLVRAVAPPYPGAFCAADGRRLSLWRTLPVESPDPRWRAAAPELRCVDGELYALCPDGALRVLAFALEGGIHDAAGFAARYGDRALALQTITE